MKPVPIEGVRALVQNGLKHIAARTINGRYSVEFDRKLFLANRQGQRRMFAKAQTMFGWLRDIGITRIDEVKL